MLSYFYSSEDVDAKKNDVEEAAVLVDRPSSESGSLIDEMKSFHANGSLRKSIVNPKYEAQPSFLWQEITKQRNHVLGLNVLETKCSDEDDYEIEDSDIKDEQINQLLSRTTMLETQLAVLKREIQTLKTLVSKLE